MAPVAKLLDRKILDAATGSIDFFVTWANSTNFTRDGILEQNVRHICRLAVSPHECCPAPDNPYYRGFNCADFQAKDGSID